MRRIITWAGRVVFSAAVVFALGFGAQQALGSARYDDCQPCYSQQECQDCCWELYEENGWCSPTNACLCY
jgi:hypothetical protein